MVQILKEFQRTLGLAAAFDRSRLGENFDYLELASRCITQNSYNRLHIELENVCTPLELAGLAELRERRPLPRQGRAWLENLRRLKPDLFDAPHAFERRAIGQQIFLYRDPRFEPAGRGLLAAFTGRGRRLMLPLAVFLQFVDPRAWDVLIVNRDVGGSYLDGLDDISQDFVGVVEHIAGAIDLRAYGKITTFGTSAGGFPALWAALLMNAGRGISICGYAPNPLPAGANPDKAVPGGTDLCFVYGGDCPRDEKAAMVLRDIYGGRLVPIAGAQTHNVIKILLSRGDLGAFMDGILS